MVPTTVRRVSRPEPSPAYRQTLVRGARALGLASAYIARLEALADNGRAGGDTA